MNNKSFEFSELKGDLSEMFNNPLYSNVTIILDKATIYAHSLVLGNRSKYFRRELSSEKYVSPGMSQNKTMKYINGSGAAYSRVFQYLYIGDYSEQLSISTLKDDPDLLKHLRVYIIAGRFLMEDLKEFSAKKIIKQLDDLEELSADNILQYTNCVREFYASVVYKNDALHQAIVRPAIEPKHGSQTTGDPGCENYATEVLGLPQFRDLLREGGRFVSEYVKAVFLLGRSRATVPMPSVV